MSQLFTVRVLKLENKEEYACTDLAFSTGEYAREVMLICPPNGPVECMPFPSPSHQRNKYTVYSKGGIRYIMQNRMGWEDFCQAPPSSAVP